MSGYEEILKIYRNSRPDFETLKKSPTKKMITYNIKESLSPLKDFLPE